jgi:hypothetical protein
MASSDFGELDAYVPLFRTIPFMRNSRVMLVVAIPESRRREGLHCAIRHFVRLSDLHGT